MNIRNLKTLVLIFFSFSLFAQLEDKKPEAEQYPFNNIGDTSRGFFGKDDRMEIKDVSGAKDYARATAVMINKKYIVNNKIKAGTLRDRLKRQFGSSKFDKNVKFLDQPTVANCTGFLIAPDIIATAGHCIKDKSKLKDYVWVFDFTLDKYSSYRGEITLDPNDIYEVAGSISDKLSYSPVVEDYAFLRLTRKSDRRPYRFRTSGKVSLFSNVYTIGAPTGLPLKFVDNSFVVDNSRSTYFKNNIDGFPGNSGGPVFNKNGFIEGIHVRGNVELSQGKWTGDYKYDEECGCITTVNWETTVGNYGSQAHKITSVPADVLYGALYDNLVYAIENNDMDRLEDWLVYSFMVDHKYTASKGRLEFIAAKKNNLKALKMIMAKSKQKNMKDANGRNLIFYAINNGNNDMLVYLLRLGTSPNTADKYNDTPLHWALKNDKSEIAKTLVDRGASVKVKNGQGDTPLHIAARGGDMPMVRLLVDKGASLTTTNNKGYTAFKAAKKAKQKAVKKYLKKAGKR
jgi:V8-like Glu-specific endopeptidase